MGLWAHQFYSPSAAIRQTRMPGNYHRVEGNKRSNFNPLPLYTFANRPVAVSFGRFAPSVSAPYRYPNRYIISHSSALPQRRLHQQQLRSKRPMPEYDQVPTTDQLGLYHDGEAPHSRHTSTRLSAPLSAVPNCLRNPLQSEVTPVDRVR